MDPSSRLSRVERDPRSDTQQVRDDSEGQGKWEHQDDNTGRPGGEAYAQQARFGKAAYGESDTGPTGLSGTTGAGDRYDAPDRQYAPETLASDEYGGRSDPSAGATFRDDDPAGTGGKASMTSKVKGTAEKMAGKVTGDQGKQARGQERQEGLY
ncbi:hypothetical protein BC826DRAFT_1048842 [Russula brevipes]|nr:hypothetical protein BC826DRAFT_1048842 [Russula brevipes]